MEAEASEITRKAKKKIKRIKYSHILLFSHNVSRHIFFDLYMINSIFILHKNIIFEILTQNPLML